MKISLLASVIALTVAQAYAAEWYGTSLDAEDHAQWNDASNWDSATGVPEVNINFTESVINEANGSKTVWLDGLYNFSGNYHLYAGTEAAPLTFKASGSNGFAATANKEMYIGYGAANPAYVVLDGGTYTFMNDINLGWNQSAATLVVNEGTRVQLPHWFKLADGSGGGAESALVVNGGEIVCGWRNDAESDNARFSIANSEGSKASVTLNSGRIRSAGGNNAGDWPFVVGLGARSHGTFVSNGGVLNVDNGTKTGRIIIGGGNTATGVVEKTAGTWTAGNDLRVAEGASSEGLLVHSGGETTVGSWLHAGIGANSHGKVVLSGGTISIPNNSCNATFGYASGALGELEMTGGNLTVKNEVYLGGQANATGTVHMVGGEFTSGGRFYVGRSGQSGACGLLTVDGGTVGTSNDFRIGDNGTVGIVTNNSGNITVGINFTVGAENTGRGEYVHNGGTNTVAKYGYVSRNGGTGYMEVNGGLMTFGEPLVVGSNGSAGRMKMTGGTISVPNSPLRLNDGTTAAVETEVLLEGGVLSCKRIETNNTGADAEAYVTLDGGTIAPNQAGQNFLVADDKIVVRVGAKGGTVDTGSIYVSGFTHEIVSALEEGETDGGLTIVGKGILPMMGAAKYTGETFVKSGVLAITNGYTFAGSVKVGRNGAITVDIAPARTAATDADGDIAVNDRIELFSTSALAFEEATDDLSTTVFLTGPVVGYTLSSETADGRTTVYATITDVANIATSRKVTTYIANGQPADNSFDVGIFCAGGIMHIYGNNNGNITGARRFGDFVVRGCTAKVRYGNKGYPDIGVKHIAGSGTLELAQAGLAGNGTLDLVSDKNVKVVITTEGASGSDRDAWIGVNNASATAATTVNGDVVTSNGFVAIWRNVTLNGSLTISPWSVNSYVGDSAGDTLVMNGDLILEDGAKFDFNSHDVTFGENARLVLKGGTYIEAASGQVWPKTVIQSGVYAYGSVPGAAEYTIAGGRLNVVPPEDGTSFSLTGVKLADGVNAADVIKITGTQYNWTVAVDAESGSITATVGAPYDSTEPTYWVGGAQGMWKQASNWTRGVPDENMTAVFTYDASCFYSDGTAIIGKIGKLVLNGHHVELATKDYSATPWGKFEIGEFDENETGTLRIFRSGLGNIGGRNLTLPSTMRLEVLSAGDKDCWLSDDNGIVTFNCPIVKLDDRLLKLIGDVHVMGGISGPGTVKPTEANAKDSPDKCRSLGGDWSGFTGTFAPDNSDERTFFTESFTGGENSSWHFPHYIRIEGSERTLKLGQVTFTNDRRIEVLKGAAITLETGARNTSFTINANVAFYENPDEQNWSGTSSQFTMGAANCTLKKTGTGTLTSNLVGAFTLDVAEGVCALASGDANVNVTVRDGATLQAANNATIGALTCEEGANIRLTTLESNPVITVEGTAVVDGVNVTLADGLADTLYAQTDPSSYSLLTVTAVEGTPVAEPVLECSAAGYGWYARVVDGSLKLVRRKPVSGCFIIVR